MRRSDLAPAVAARLERLPPPFEAHYGVLPTPPPEHAVALGTMTAAHGRAMAALATVATLARQYDDPYVISRLLARQEAVSSSSIEGTNSTLDELLSVEEDAGDTQRDATLQVRDYALILDRLVPLAAAEGPAVFTNDLMTELHRGVMQGDPDYRDPSGGLRDRVVWIGGHHIARSTFNPPPPDRVPACLADTIDYLQSQGMQVMTQSIVARMAIAHAHFEAVHPFRDGNGRVGRLLLPLMMAADGQIPLYLSPFIEAHKQAYYDSLRAAQQRLEWEVAIGFMADAIAGTVDELIATRAALTTVAAAWRTRRRYRRHSAAERSLALLPHYPVVTVRRLADRLGVSQPAAWTAIGQLVDAGVLQEATGFSRNRVFVAREVLVILNRPFGETPILPV